MNTYRIFIAIVLLCSFHMISAQKQWKVVSSASIFQDMVANIGKDKIEALTIVPIGGDPHTYEPRPSDAALVADADLILINGFNFEGWISELIENSGTKAKVITITEGVQPIASSKYKNAYDPHAWMDAGYGQLYIRNITNALAAFDSENEPFYRSNESTYLTKLQELDKYIMDAVKAIPEKARILITSHDAFAYYGDRYGIQVSPIMGISTDAEVQTSDIIRVTKIIQESGVPAIFIESTINPKLLEQIARDNKISIGGELFSDSIGDEKSEANSYLNMLRHNTDVIVNALSKGINSKTKIDTDDRSANWWLYGLLAIVMLGSLVFFIFKFNK